MEINKFKEMENKWKKFWEKERIYKFDSKRKKRIYSIDTPPPTVSGEMHMGHTLMYSQMDFIARYKRMVLNGKGQVFYPFGTDDNGLPTEKLIEKIKNVKSREMSRQEFIKLCLKTLKEILPKFVQNWKDLGVSCDYSKIYSTIDDNSRKISQIYFIDAYKKDLVYKKEFPAIWDTTFQTAIAQAELEDKLIETLFTTIKFSVKNSNENILIATTRPELFGACVAVFVNPKDKKYKKFVGKKAIVPIFNHEVPILEDSSAKMEKGTGALMVCSYGDKYDVDGVQRHKLKPRIILNKDGTLNIKPYKGMKAEQAREKILQDLKNKNLVVEEKKLNHIVNVYEKSGTPIEFIPTEQWFFKTLEFKKKLIKDAKKINWLPKHMFKRYENWVNGLEWDWILSRERHFGVPIPVWNCPRCNEVILAKESELPVDPVEIKKKCPKCRNQAEPEVKVLDTWATSSLSPQIASNLFDNKIKIPYSLRPQGHDIIRTWAFYTILRSILHEKKIPWENAFITGNVTLKGEKMGKSKGNVIAPQDLMEKYGSDAVRYWASSSKLGYDFDYNEKDVLTGKRFVTKIQNASKFVFMNIKNKPKKVNLEEVDRLFLLELNKTIKICTDAFESYNYSKAKFEADNFFWKVFADNYLEIIKKRIYNEKGNKKISAEYTLYHSLLAILKLMAPFTPFITEDIYQKYFKKNEKDKSIHISSWPEEFKLKKGKEDEKTFNLMIRILSKVRQEKSNAKKSMKSEIVLTLERKDKQKLKKVLDDLMAVTNAKEIKEGKFGVEFLN